MFQRDSAVNTDSVFFLKSWLTKNVMIGAAYARHGARQGQRIPLAQYKEVDLHCTFFRKNTESVLTAESR